MCTHVHNTDSKHGPDLHPITLGSAVEKSTISQSGNRTVTTAQMRQEWAGPDYLGCTRVYPRYDMRQKVTKRWPPEKAMKRSSRPLAVPREPNIHQHPRRGIRTVRDITGGPEFMSGGEAAFGAFLREQGCGWAGTATSWRTGPKWESVYKVLDFINLLPSSWPRSPSLHETRLVPTIPETNCWFKTAKHQRKISKYI